MFRTGLTSAAALYDEAGTRAWTLARWMTGDDELARQVLLEAFTACDAASDGAGPDSACVLRDVRRRALALQADGPTSLEPMAAAVRALPEPMRELVELVVIGRLGLRAATRACEMAPSDGFTRLADAMRTVAASISPPLQPN